MGSTRAGWTRARKLSPEWNQLFADLKSEVVGIDVRLPEVTVERAEQDLHSPHEHSKGAKAYMSTRIQCTAEQDLHALHE